MLIKNSADRTARHREKIEAVLGFLRREIYSDFSTINRLFGFKNHRGLYDLLNKLVAEGGLKKHRIGKRVLWSITATGAASEGTNPRFRGDGLSTTKAASIAQRLAEQNARLSCEAGGGTGWFSASDPLYPSQTTPRPTAIFTQSGGERAAVVVETRMKTQARYREVVKNHLLARKQREWLAVLYVVPSESHKIAVRLYLRSLEYVNVGGVRYPITPEHLAIFNVVSQEELREQGL